jgi:uncharacterized protein (DUF305 family)
MYSRKFMYHNVLRVVTVMCFTAVSIVPRGLVAQGAAAKAGATPAAKKDYTPADVTFMQGMIHHHAQAVTMGKMAVSHGASPAVATFCKKVIISQNDEIGLMQTWLKDRGETYPDPLAMEGHDMAGMKGHDMATMKGMNAGAMSGMTMDDHASMPGMLTPKQMAQLDKARGKAWDRLFLTFMIQHHEGALVMVKTLFDAPGGGQGPEIFGYATGVDADQRGEIERMQKMLSATKGKTTK